MKNKWNDIEIHGYKYETIPAGPGHSKLAGLIHELAEKYESMDKEVYQRVMSGEFKGKKHRVEYVNGNLKQMNQESKEVTDIHKETKERDKGTDQTETITEEISKLKI